MKFELYNELSETHKESCNRRFDKLAVSDKFEQLTKEEIFKLGYAFALADFLTEGE